MKPECSVEVEDTLKRLHHGFQRILKQVNSRKKWSNLTSLEKHTAKTLLACVAGALFFGGFDVVKG